MCKKFLFFLIFVTCFNFSFQANAFAADCWLSVDGSGEKNGSDQSNAYPAKEAQKCWEQTSADGTMYVMEGIYNGKRFWTLKIDAKHGGSPLKDFKKLTGIGKVELEGNNTERWIYFKKGAQNVSIQNFWVNHVLEGVVAVEGKNKRLRFENIHFADTRQNFVLDGHPSCGKVKVCKKKASEVTHNIAIKNTSGIRYSKRHVRLGKGIYRVQVSNSHADAEFLDGDFAVGFDVEGPSHDIEFINSSSRRNMYSLSSYWNGDGFKAEDDTWNIKWINCSAFDNADAGFDIKTKNAYLENVVALRNNRNIRTWNPKGAVLKNVNASFSKHLGGEGSEAGIWSRGVLDCYSCKVHNNKTQVMTEKGEEPALIRFFDSVLTSNRADSILLIREDGTQIDFIRTSIWQNNPMETHYEK